MTSRDFCYWLQGFFELQQAGSGYNLTASQADLVRRHLALVFKHEIDPSAGPAEHQAMLDNIHAGLTGPNQTKPPQIGGHGMGPNGEPIVYRC